MSNINKKGIVLCIISKLGTVKFDRLFDTIFLASLNGLVNYDFNDDYPNVLTSSPLRKDLVDLFSKGLISIELERVSDEFEESTHVYRITEYGASAVNKIREKVPTYWAELDEFLRKYKGMAPGQLEQEVIGMRRR